MRNPAAFIDKSEWPVLGTKFRLGPIEDTVLRYAPVEYPQILSLMLLHQRFETNSFRSQHGLSWPTTTPLTPTPLAGVWGGTSF